MGKLLGKNVKIYVACAAADTTIGSIDNATLVDITGKTLTTDYVWKQVNGLTSKTIDFSRKTTDVTDDDSGDFGDVMLIGYDGKITLDGNYLNLEDFGQEALIAHQGDNEKFTIRYDLGTGTGKPTYKVNVRGDGKWSSGGSNEAMKFNAELTMTEKPTKSTQS